MKQPNIILIFCDDLGYGDLECYGSDRNHTPRLNQMANEGMRFTDFYVPSPLCSPSRAALMTGCYPDRIGLGTGDKFVVLLPGDPIGLHPDEITLPRILKQQGYSTKMIGKWHLGDQAEFWPTRHGFDSYYGLPYSNDMHPRNTKQFNFPPLPLMREERIIEIAPDQTDLTERYTHEAVEYMNEAVRFMSDNKEQPFFLYFAHLYVHVPLHAPKAFIDRSKNGLYGAEVECIDWSTGVILDTLKDLGIDDNTLVIFTSDNGAILKDGGSNAPLRGTKGRTWEGGMRMPCLMRWPSQIPAGSLCQELCSTMDLMPTLSKLSGGQAPNDRQIDGHDIRSLMFAEEGASTPYEAFFYYRNASLEAVRAGPWKLHLNLKELYHLGDDIGESQNRYEQQPEVVAKLEAMAETCRRELGDRSLNITGEGCREVGRVDNPTTLTPHDPQDLIQRFAYD